MARRILIAVTLLLCGCSGTHGYAVGSNDGAGIGVNILHARLP